VSAPPERVIGAKLGYLVMIAAIALGLLLAWGQVAKTAAQPRVSATDTAYLSCTTWTGKEWTNPIARSSRTPLTESPKGFSAYGEVKVLVKDGSCENVTKLYVASRAAQSFRIVYAEPPSGSGDGNGIRLIGWSPSGDKLLAQVNLWKYETDRGFAHVALIYDASKGQAEAIHALDEALSHHFASNCEFETAVVAWKTDEQIIVKVSRTPEDQSYEQRFCVTAPRLFIFDLRRQTIEADEPGHTRTN
jgi:hypothetical protein